MGNSAPYTATSRPSQRTPTAAQVNHSSNARWLPNTWYALGDMKTVLQEVVNRPDWQSGNAVSAILKGSGTGTWSRKFFRSFEAGAVTAPRLVVTYTSGTAGPPLPTASLTVNPSSIQSGGTATLSWTTTNATTVTFNQGIGTVAATGAGV